VSAKIYACHIARELRFEWRIGENAARTLAFLHEVSATAKPPQTTSHYVGLRDGTRGLNGVYRRRCVSAMLRRK